METVYVVEWGNGNVDVFGDRGEAAECYRVQNRGDATEEGMLQHVLNGGKTVSVEEAFDNYPNSASTIWSQKAYSALSSIVEPCVDDDFPVELEYPQDVNVTDRI